MSDDTAELPMMGVAYMVVECTTDDPDDPKARWTPLMPADLPPSIRSPEVMGRMRMGEAAQIGLGGVLWYRARVLADEAFEDLPTEPAP